MPQWKVDIPALQLAIESVQRYRRTSAREVALEIGVPPSTLTRLKDGHRLDVDAFVSMLEWLNMSHQRFVVPSDGTARQEEELVMVSRRDVMIAWSWAQEALKALPENRLPTAAVRARIEASLQALVEELGLPTTPAGMEGIPAPRSCTQS